MLSNTAETNPRPSAVCHDATGSFSTGIIEAAVTSASKKIVPLNVSGITAQSGRRNGAAGQKHRPHREPKHRHATKQCRKMNVGDDVHHQRNGQHCSDDKYARPVDHKVAASMLDDGRVAMLLQGCRHREDQKRDNSGAIGFEDAQRAYSSNPHHSRCGIADHASGATRIRGNNDCGEITHMNFAAKDMAHHRAPNDHRGNIIEKTR